MRLALAVEYYPPSRASAAVQMADLANHLARDGHDVTVFTTSSEIERLYSREASGGVTVIRVRTRKTKGSNLVSRAVSEIVMPYQLWRGARHAAFDASALDGIIWYSPTIFLAPFIAWLKHRSGAPAYLILRDIFPQWAVDAGVMRRGPAYFFFKAFEHLQYRVADVVGVQSPANLDYFRSNKRGVRRFEVLYNWIELGRPTSSRSDLVDRSGIADKRLVVYGGNMGIAQDVENLLRLAQRLSATDEIRLLLIGAGTEVPRLRREIAERKLDNVKLVDEVDPEEFRAILRRCHVGLITLDRRLTTHNIPGKLLAYLEAALPVVASSNPGNDLLSILQESGAGLGFVNGEDEQFADGVRALVLDAARCASMSENARALAVSRFSIGSIARQLTAALANPRGADLSSEAR
jgi:glycosyltransferase involved in cell wall biosynthesis